MPEFMGTKTMSVYDEGTILNEDGTVIAEFFEAEYVANARAFAAVPEMIEALKKLMTAYRHDHGLDGAYDEPLVFARAALSKALGGDLH